MKSGLYICKCYQVCLNTWKVTPVLKFGMTSDIDKRMYFYNKDVKRKQLLAFFPCKKEETKFREDLFKEFSSFADNLRCQKHEYIDFESGYFRRMYNDLTYWSKVTWIKTPQGIEFNEL